MAKKEPGGVACKYSASCFDCPRKDCTINDAEVVSVNLMPYDIEQRWRRNAGKSEEKKVQGTKLPPCDSHCAGCRYLCHPNGSQRGRLMLCNFYLATGKHRYIGPDGKCAVRETKRGRRNGKAE